MPEVFIETERLIISSVTKSSYENVTKLYADIKNNSYATGVFYEIPENEVEKRTSFDNTIKTGFNLEANLKENGSFIGYLRLSLLDEATTVWMYTLIIVPDEWRKGYGTELVTAVENYMRREYGTCFIGLSVAETNIRAKKFWESLGYRINKTLIKSEVESYELSKINIYVKLF